MWPQAATFEKLFLLCQMVPVDPAGCIQRNGREKPGPQPTDSCVFKGLTTDQTVESSVLGRPLAQHSVSLSRRLHPFQSASPEVHL